MVRILIGLLLGFILGIGGTLQFLASGGGEMLVVSSPRARELEEQVKQCNQQIERLAVKLEAAADAMEKTAAKFTALEQRVAQGQHLSPSTPTQPTAEAVPPLPMTPPTPPEEEGPHGTEQQPADAPSPSL